MTHGLRINALLFTALLPWTLSRVSAATASRGPEGQPPERAPANAIFVEQQTDCMAISDIKAALEAVLRPREESKYMIVTVVVAPAVDGSLAALRVIERKSGEILFTRTLPIKPEECAEAHLVLKIVLEQFLTGFPIERWKEPAPPAQEPVPCPSVQRVVVEEPVVPLRAWISFGVDSRWPSPSGGLELALGVDAGGERHGLIVQLVTRAGWPKPLGEGRYLETAGLLSAGWRFSSARQWIVRLEARVGALRVSGIGFEQNYHRWLILVEGQLSVLWRLGPLFLGPEVAACPLIHRVHTESGAEQTLPWIRAGLVLSVPLARTKLK